MLVCTVGREGGFSIRCCVYILEIRWFLGVGLWDRMGME